MEASSITGPAKNLLNFCRWTKTPEAAALGLNFSVELATYSRGPDAENLFVQEARRAGISMNVIPERRRFDRSIIPALSNLVDRIRPHVVQTHSVKSHFLYKATGIPKRLPWIAFHHGYTAIDLKMRLYNQLDRWSLRSAHRVVTVCQDFIPQLVSRGVDRARVSILHNSVRPIEPVPEEEVNSLRASFGIASGEIVMLAIGRFSSEKGHPDLLEALARLRRGAPGLAWKLILVGTGPDQLLLERLVADRGLTGRVIFAGFHSNVAPFYALAGIFVLPSLSEGSPNVLLEAMAARLPVAATRVGGVPEIVSHGQTAMVVPARDPRAMAEALEALCTDPALRERLAAAAFERAVHDFSPGRYLRNLVGVYSETLGLQPVPADYLS
jgi:glycosyltransferase involved in cell wall biosynthesis